MTDCTYTNVFTVKEALSLAKKYEKDFVYSAGGTDLQIYRKQKLNLKSHVIDLSEINELKIIQHIDNVLEIGSMATIEQLIESSDIIENFPLIREAALSIATPVIRKSATIGGNLMVANRCNYYNQSQFWRESAGSCLRDIGNTCLAVGSGDKCFSRNVSDLAPVLIALNAQITIYDHSQSKTIPLLDLYLPDGINFHKNLNNMIIRSIKVKLKPSKYWFQKLRRRNSIDFTSLTVAAVMDNKNQASVCINGVSMSPILICFDMSKSDLADIQKIARKTCKTVDNDFLSLKYRREMIDIYLSEFFKYINQI